MFFSSHHGKDPYSFYFSFEFSCLHLAGQLGVGLSSRRDPPVEPPSCPFVFFLSQAPGLDEKNRLPVVFSRRTALFHQPGTQGSVSGLSDGSAFVKFSKGLIGIFRSIKGGRFLPISPPALLRILLNGTREDGAEWVHLPEVSLTTATLFFFFHV